MNDEEYYRSLGPWFTGEQAAGGLLAVEFAGGVVLYPAWQFGTDGQPLPGLAQVLDTLRPGFRAPASQAGWLCARAYIGEEQRRWECLAAGDVELVESWAREDAARVTAR